MNIERRLIEKVGPVGGKLHTGRSRNDQIAVDMRLWLRAEIETIQRALREVQAALVEQAERHRDCPMPGYTHLQRAQPILLAHHLLAYFFMLQRDRGRLADARRRLDVLPLGAGALAGTTVPIDRHALARDLGFATASPNSLDAVADRDFALEFTAAAAILAMHTSRLAGEVVLWATAEFGFVELPDAYATGSSIMPQKKNPDIAELVRGKTGRVYGDLVRLLTVMKGLPLAYHSDMQEDKEAFFDAADTVRACLGILAPFVRALRFRPERLRALAGESFSTATDLADYLVRKGVPFRTAHELVGKAVALALGRGVALPDLPLEALRGLSPLFEADFRDAVTVEASLAARNVYGGTGPKAVEQELAEARALLEEAA
jgi:argininosuccinate lyase